MVWHYHHLPDDPLAALNILREAAGWSRCPLPTTVNKRTPAPGCDFLARLVSRTVAQDYVHT